MNVAEDARWHRDSSTPRATFKFNMGWCVSYVFFRSDSWTFEKLFRHLEAKSLNCEDASRLPWHDFLPSAHARHLPCTPSPSKEKKIKIKLTWLCVQLSKTVREGLNVYRYRSVSRRRRQESKKEASYDKVSLRLRFIYDVKRKNEREKSVFELLCDKKRWATLNSFKNSLKNDGCFFFHHWQKSVFLIFFPPARRACQLFFFSIFSYFSPQNV